MHRQCIAFLKVLCIRIDGFSKSSGLCDIIQLLLEYLGPSLVVVYSRSPWNSMIITDYCRISLEEVVIGDPGFMLVPSSYRRNEMSVRVMINLLV